MYSSSEDRQPGKPCRRRGERKASRKQVYVHQTQLGKQLVDWN